MTDETNETNGMMNNNGSPLGTKVIRMLNKAMIMLEHGDPKNHTEALAVYWQTRRLPTRKSLEYEDDLGIEGPDYYLYERLETFFDFDVLRATKGPSRSMRVQRYLRENFPDYEHLSKMFRQGLAGAEYRHQHFIKTDPDYAAIHAPQKGNSEDA